MAHIIKTPHPVTLEGQEKIPVHLLPGESLYALLQRALGEQLDGELWRVSVAGVEVPMQDWPTHYPKDGQVIECVGDVGRSALMMVAVVALSIWTGGLAATVAASGGIAGLGTVASYAAIAGISVAGSLLITKVLGPKAAGAGDTSSAPASQSLSGSQNQARQYGAVPILFGRYKVAPDLLSQPYGYYDSDDMYLALHLSFGIGVGRIETLYNGTTPLSDYDDAVQQYNTGFSQMASQAIPLFGATESTDGGALQEDEEDGDETLLTVTRTTAAATARVLMSFSGTLFGITRKGKLSENQEGIIGEYRAVGQGGWQQMFFRFLRNDDRRTLRFSIPFDFPTVGQYEVRARRSGQNSQGDNDECQFALDSVLSIERDTSDYAGIARTGLTLRATSRLAGTPNEITAISYASPIPVWKGSYWATEETSNPGAHMLKYMRGYYDENGTLVAGMGLDDSDIDIPALQSFMLHCATEGFEYNYLLKDDRDHLTVLDTIAASAMGQFTDAGGLNGVVWVAEDQAVDGTINMARIKRGTFRVDYSLIATADGVAVRYWDADQNKEALLRVPMPGVQTILAPASLTLEGVTSEAQAAFLARYYLAQSLYQYKDVGFGVSLENLTFRRLSLLQMQHDMTQWGYGGVVVGVQAVGTRLQLTLDDAVPPPPSGRQAYIGIRVPGQRAAAVLKVRAFTEATNIVTLDEVWPSDLPVPGNTSDNPAHDSIWIYDFKETPGLTVRVTDISRAADRSATVSAVQESAEFWTYVRTGEYHPADSGSLLRTRPLINDMEVVEQQYVVGDVAQDQLAVSFSVEGPYDRARVYTTEPGGELRLRAETLTRNAVFDIAGPGVYTVTVFPYNAEGLRGVGKSVIFTTKDAGQPPVLVDYFDVTQVSGGVRFYNWGFYADTIQSADFVGVELRYAAGDDVSAYDWETMTPIGETGYHTIPFEAVVPTSGKYIFACRSRNSAGVLSADARVIARELGANLGEVIEQIKNDNEGSFEEVNQELQAVQAALVEEARLREEAVRAESDTRQAAVVALEQSIAKTAQDLLNEELAREAAITEEQTIRQTADESLALQISQISAGTGDQFDSARIWYFDADAEGWTGTAADGFLNPGGPVATSPAIAVTGTEYRYVKARIKRVGPAIPWSGVLSWTNDAGTTGTADIAEPTFDANGIATVDAQDIGWTGTVTSFSLQLGAVTPDTYYLYDWVAIGRPTPGASVAMVQEEASARVAADSAEALQRTILAAQVRGTYDGDDAAQLSSGLIYSEGRLRVEGDQVLATRIESLQVGIDGNSAAITNEATARANADAALAEDITRVSAELGDKADATVVQELTTRVEQTEEGLEAQATLVQRLDVQLYGEHAGDTDDYAGDPEVYAGTLTAYSAIADGDRASAQSIESVRAEFAENTAQISQQLFVTATATSAQAQSIQALQVSLGTKADASAVNTLTTQVQQLDQTVQANAQSISQVSARVDGKADASVVQELGVTVESTTGKVAQINARYFLGVQANGLVGGMYIGNNGELVNVRFQSDKFTIESPSGSGERLEYSNNNLRIYDANNVLRVQMGVLN